MTGEPESSEVMVLLSAWNGERYIAEQIESIRAQSFRNWQLVVRDDDSTDDTVAIVRKIAAGDPRISLIEDSKGNLGPWASFGSLLFHAYDLGAQYVFLSDQDDVWLPDKMERQLSLIRAAETSGDASQPLLVHSDLQVVDAELRPIHQSFSEYERTSYDADDPLRTLLIHNAVVGCTIAVNRQLLEFALPLPLGSLHDWWLSLCTAATGKILRTSTPTVRYRHHDSNVVGAAPRHDFARELVSRPLVWTSNAFRSFGRGVEQAQRLRDRMRSKGFTADARFERVERYCDAFADNRSLASRLRAYRLSGARPQRVVSRVILYGLLAVFPRAQSMLER